MADSVQDATTNEAAIAGVDHSIVGVADLEAARTAYEAMGFTMTPRGRHIGWSTANYCIMFERDYIELLGIVDPDGYAAGLDTILAEHGEGLLKLAMRSEDATRSHDFFESHALITEPVKELARELEAPEGTVLPEFRLVHPKPEATPGLAGFICQHLTPEMVWRPQWLQHRNTATGMRSYAILADDPALLAAGWVRLFGAGAVSRDGGWLSVKTGTARLDFLPWDELPSAFADVEFDHPQAGNILGMTIGVTDLVETAVCLAEAGAACMRTDKGMTVMPESACGVAISFVQES
ncbi:MAG: VOC family protein [Alphaproteobacteria bacterium]|nr:VOC family protein [Alphaproteobacteria bacterium]